MQIKQADRFFAQPSLQFVCKLGVGAICSTAKRYESIPVDLWAQLFETGTEWGRYLAHPDRSDKEHQIILLVFSSGTTIFGVRRNMMSKAMVVFVLDLGSVILTWSAPSVVARLAARS